MTTSGTYSLYKITNSLNGKTYIGFTSRSLLTRWKEHVRHAKKHANNGHFYRAIRKYGQDVFLMELLETFKTPNEAKEAEILFIAKMKPEYNSTKGGDGSPGHFVSEESRKKWGKFIKIINTI
jgi:group I intron endonuclease